MPGWGGQREGAGRPPRTDGRESHLVRVALTDEEYRQIINQTDPDERRLRLMEMEPRKDILTTDDYQDAKLQRTSDRQRIWKHDAGYYLIATYEAMADWADDTGEGEQVRELPDH